MKAIIVGQQEELENLGISSLKVGDVIEVIPGDSDKYGVWYIVKNEYFNILEKFLSFL